MNRAHVNSMQQFAAGGGSAMKRLLQCNMQVNSLRTNGLLRKDEWISLDTRVVEIARGRLTAIADLQARGLTHPLGGLGVLMSEYERQGDMTPATTSMSVLTQTQRDAVDFDLQGVPVPITWKEFQIDARRLAASRQSGSALDTTQAEISARKVSEGLESLVFHGSGVQVDGRTIYGYTTHPQRLTGTAVDTWDDITAIYPTVLDMIGAAHAKNMYGPYILYVAGDIWRFLLQIYTDGSGQSAMQRIKSGIPGLEDIKPSDELASGDLVLVQMTRDVVDLAVAQDIVTLEWEERGGLVGNFIVMGVMVPRVKATKAGQCGVVHFTGAAPSGA